MSYPPKFSNEIIYENRLDLDKIDVFIEGDGNNPMFFDVTGIPSALSFGKHYFNISLLNTIKEQYNLKSKSQILFEFKSVNGVVLKSDVTNFNQRNGVIVAYVEVLKDPLRTFEEVEDGPGTLNICATLTNKENTRNRIPNNYLNTINYRCTWPIDIRKNLVNADSPLVLQSEHVLTTTKGFFSFGKASISTRRSAKTGNVYAIDGAVSDFDNDDTGQTE